MKPNNVQEFTLIELLAVIAICSLPCSCRLWPKPSSGSIRTQCLNNVHRIMIALNTNSDRVLIADAPIS